MCAGRCAIAVELARNLGFHGVCLDLEHGAFSRSQVDELVLLARSLNLASYARVAAPTRIDIQHFLDSGGDGVILPHIDDLNHAREICATAKYPPLGTRSVGGGRAWNWSDPPPNWVRKENRRVQCYPMVETPGSLAAVDEIATLPTVDGLFLGPFDLNMSMGRGGRFGAGQGTVVPGPTGTTLTYGGRDGLGGPAHREDRQQRPEDFVLRDSHVRLNIGKYGRFDKITFRKFWILGTLTAHYEASTALLSVRFSTGSC